VVRVELARLVSVDDQHAQLHDVVHRGETRRDALGGVTRDLEGGAGQRVAAAATARV
jgi:hypothetical protein